MNSNRSPLQLKTPTSASRPVSAALKKPGPPLVPPAHAPTPSMPMHFPPPVQLKHNRAGDASQSLQLSISHVPSDATLFRRAPLPPPAANKVACRGFRPAPMIQASTNGAVAGILVGGAGGLLVAAAASAPPMIGPVTGALAGLIGYHWERLSAFLRTNQAQTNHTPKNKASAPIKAPPLPANFKKAQPSAHSAAAAKPPQKPAKSGGRRNETLIELFPGYEAEIEAHEEKVLEYDLALNAYRSKAKWQSTWDTYCSESHVPNGDESGYVSISKLSNDKEYRNDQNYLPAGKYTESWVNEGVGAPGQFRLIEVDQLIAIGTPEKWFTSGGTHGGYGYWRYWNDISKEWENWNTGSRSGNRFPTIVALGAEPILSDRHRQALKNGVHDLTIMSLVIMEGRPRV